MTHRPPPDKELLIELPDREQIPPLLDAREA
jgi:hypothetical protein